MNRKIRAYHHPLEQIAKRLGEIESNAKPSGKNILNSRPSVKHPIVGDVNSFQTIIFKDYRLSTRRIGDRWFLLKSSNKLVKFDKVLEYNINKIIICGKEIPDANNFFIKPFFSKHIDIFISDCKEENEIVCTVDDIKCKLFRLLYEDKFVFQALLHSVT